MRFVVLISGKKREVEISQWEAACQCRVDGRTVEIDVAPLGLETLSILYRGKSYTVRQGVAGMIRVGERDYEIVLDDPRSWRSRHEGGAGASGPQKLAAMMPGKVVRVLGRPGAHIEAGQGLVVIEAMKMQNEIRAQHDGTIKSILVREGQTVNAGEVVAIIE